MTSEVTEHTYNALFLFAGLGGGARGFIQANAETRSGLAGKFVVCGAVDNDPAAARDFETLTGFPCTVADLGTMLPDELRAACTAPPDIVFLSAPCKGLSGCLPAAKSATPKYQAMNSLGLRGLMLVMEAWPARQRPALLLFENVPRITTRGREVLRQITGMLQSYGYACRETVHDCGELGGLGQRRRRFLLVARHTKRVPNLWFVPDKKPLRSVGEVIGELPIPWPNAAVTEGGPMHRLPKLSAMNWLRLALIPAGGDWRDLPKQVRIVAGPERHHGDHGVQAWDDTGRTVIGAADAQHGASVADPRIAEHADRHNGPYGVQDWQEPSHSVVAAAHPRNSFNSIADPRLSERAGRQNGGFGVNEYDEPAHTVMGEGTVRNTWSSVADPRVHCEPRSGVYGVASAGDPSNTITGNARVDNGPFSVADPRPTCEVREGAYGVTDWQKPSTTVIAHGTHHNGPWQVADPRPKHESRGGSCGVQAWDAPGATVIGESNRFHGQNTADPRGAARAVLWINEAGALTGPAEALARFDVTDARPMTDPPILIARDGTWHRPMTTLELAALQGLPVGGPGAWLVLDGKAHKRWREVIGNAVPSPTAEAIATSALKALLAAEEGAWELGSTDVWVQPMEPCCESGGAA